MRLLRLWHTVRWLKPEQIYFRIWRWIYTPGVPDLESPKHIEPISSWPLPQWRPPSLLGERTFMFLNRKIEAGRSTAWNALSDDKLWLYNLHYFDDLNAEQFDTRREWHLRLIADWICGNPPAKGNGWEPYPIALRVVNWVIWDIASKQLSFEARESLALQTRVLRSRLEYHLLGNHLWADAKALIFSGVYFSGKDADEWRMKGLSLLASELKEQVLDDGGHFELSPMYHCIILNDLIELVALADCYPESIDEKIVTGWRSTIVRMATWLEGMSHPDGDVASFNDTALGISPRLEQIRARMKAIRMSPPATAVGNLRLFPQSGYARLSWGNAVLLVDIGAIGPDYLPGHAHADTLNMELSIGGHRLVVDPGTSVYHDCPERLRQRGTAAHNTVIVNNENSSEVWSSFRVARRAFARSVTSGEDGDLVWVAAAHDGYMRLPGKVTHWRRWDMQRGQLSVRDRLRGQYSSAEGGFLIHPEWKALMDGEAVALVRDDTKVKVTAIDATLSLSAAIWSPTFGRDLPSVRITVSPLSPEWETSFSWG